MTEEISPAEMWRDRNRDNQRRYFVNFRMTLFCIGIFQKSSSNTNLIQAEYDLSSFSFFTRSNIKEFMLFTMNLVVKKTDYGSKGMVEENGYFCYCFVNTDGLTCSCICCKDYPDTTAFKVLRKVLNDYTISTSKSNNSEILTSSSPSFNLLGSLQSYQDPKKVDTLTQIFDELEDTKKVMCKTMEELLERGEKLDDLVAKSDLLSGQSKTFYTTARKHNSCC